MQAVIASEQLWAANMAPGGLLEEWRALDGARVEKGQALVELRIEDALHEILAPAGGVLVRSAKTGDVIQPGDRLGWVANPASP